MVYKQKVTLDDYIDRTSSEEHKETAPIKTIPYEKQSVLEFMKKNMVKKVKSKPVLDVPAEAMNEGYEGMYAALGVSLPFRIDTEIKVNMNKDLNFKERFYRHTEIDPNQKYGRKPKNDEIDFNDV